MPVNPKEYTYLRTMLDSLQVGALRFYLDGTVKMSQPKKIEYLEGMLKPLIEALWHPEQGPSNIVESDCPPGYYDCEGCCVPYKCPDLSIGPKPRPKKQAKSAKKR